MKLFVLFYMFLSHGAEFPLEFSSKGQKLKSLTPDQVQTQLPSEVMKVYEPQEKKQKSYRGFDVLKLLQNVYGNDLAHFDMVSFYCEDGYRADIPLKEFKEKKSLLAYGMKDNSPFTLKGPQASIALAPYYLVWDHPNAEAAAKDVYRWPYAVIKIDLIQSSNAYQKLQTSAPYREGQQLFMKHCFSCHTLNGAGGHRGPPLTPFFLSQPHQRLEGYALDPKKFNKNSQMSGLSQNLKDREQLAKKIIDYGKKTAQP